MSYSLSLLVVWFATAEVMSCDIHARALRSPGGAVHSAFRHLSGRTIGACDGLKRL